MKNASSSVLTRTAQDIGDILGRGARLGIDALGSALGGQTRPRVGSPGCMPRPFCDHEIPAPCWEPQPLGEVISFVCAGHNATVQFRITNCGMRPRVFDLHSTGDDVGITFTPAKLSLGAMERGVIGAAATIPADAAEGEEREALIWIRGCNLHFLRWTIKVSERGDDACHEVCVEDCPDPIHHWYDHFYCRRSCSHGERGKNWPVA